MADPTDHGAILLEGLTQRQFPSDTRAANRGGQRGDQNRHSRDGTLGDRRQQQALGRDQHTLDQSGALRGRLPKAIASLLESVLVAIKTMPPQILTHDTGQAPLFRE